MNEKIMDNVVKFLREEREKRKITQGQLSYKSGISVSIISKIEQGLRSPTVNTVLAMGKALGINTMLLLEKMNVVTKEEIESHINERVSKKLDENIEYISEQTEEGNLIPVYSSVSAGVGRIPDSMPEDYFTFPIKNSANLIGIKVQGDSMYPAITNGAIIILEKDVEVLDGEIGVFIVNEEAFVKRVVYKDNLVLLYSDNILYTPIIVTKKDDFKICGKVIRTLNKF